MEKLVGIPVSSGIGIGRAFVHRLERPQVSRRRIPRFKVEAETERFLNCLVMVGEEIRRTRRTVEFEHGTDLAQIFEAQLTMLQDDQVKGSTVRSISTDLVTAEHAFLQTMERLKEMFGHIENEYLRARVGDITDIEHQVMARLAGGELRGLESVRSNTIVIAHDLLPSEAIQLGRRLVKGLVTDLGGATSHASIIARSLGLPSVVGTLRATAAISSGDSIIVDGDAGIVQVQPTPATERHYQTERRRQLRRERSLRGRRDLPAITRDGVEILLQANIDLPQETELAVANGASGVGMLRSEYLFMGYRLPAEDEQTASYGQVVKGMAPLPVVIRTLDLGGDKLSHVIESTPEANPFLGWRGIRLCLDEPEIFKTQLKAILRAGAGGEVHLLLPMVSTLEQVRQARQVIAQARTELEQKGQPFQAECKLGIMVEVPSTAIMADRFAPEIDFFSLGTNDLVQYTLAVDRGMARVADLYDPFDPAVLRLISGVTTVGKAHNIPTSICGEIAGDPTATMLLVGLGLERFSMSPGLIPEVKEVVRAISQAEAKSLAEECMAMESGRRVWARVEEATRRYLPDEHAARGSHGRGAGKQQNTEETKA